MTQEFNFRKYRPDVTAVTSVQAGQHWNYGNEILSLNGKRAALSHFILMLATDSDTFGPYIMNGVCARELCALLANEGFGPQES